MSSPSSSSIARPRAIELSRRLERALHRLRGSPGARAGSLPTDGRLQPARQHRLAAFDRLSHRCRAEDARRGIRRRSERLLAGVSRYLGVVEGELGRFCGLAEVACRAVRPREQSPALGEPAVVADLLERRPWPPRSSSAASSRQPSWSPVRSRTRRRTSDACATACRAPTAVRRARSLRRARPRPPRNRPSCSRASP